MRLSVKLKLAGAFGVVILLTATVGGVAYVKLSSMNQTVDRILADRVAGLETSLNLKLAVLQSIQDEKNAILDTNDADVAKDIAAMRAVRTRIAETFVDMRNVMAPDVSPISIRSTRPSTPPRRRSMSRSDLRR